MLKQWQNILHVIVNVNFIAQHVIQCEWRNYRQGKKYYTLSPSTCICEKSKCLKSIADTSVIACDEIIDAIDIVSTNMTHTIATSIV